MFDLIFDRFISAMEEVCARYEKLNETRGVFDEMFAGYQKRIYTVCYIAKTRFLISCSWIPEYIRYVILLKTGF